MIEFGDVDEFTNTGKELELFSEWEEVVECVKVLSGDDDGDSIQTPTAISSHVENILERYQEQPHLLDSHLETIVTILLSTIQNNIKDETKQGEVDAAFNLLYTLTKVRGYKTVLKRFSHESGDLMFVLSLVEDEEVGVFSRWKHRYILLLWLSLISLLPFNIAVFDEEDSDGSGVVRKIFAVCKQYLSATDKASDGAAQVAARFFSRPDVASNEHLHAFMTWGIGAITQSEDISFSPIAVGVLKSFAAMFKIGKREHLLPYAADLIELIESNHLMQNSNTLIRKLTMKLIQRVGLVYLPPRVAKWRYNRGARSLTHNIKQSENCDDNNNNGDNVTHADVKEHRGDGHTNEEEEEGEDDYEIADEIEVIVDVLLSGLGDKDTIVRWSSAKGIGRITGRLPQELADEVVLSLLEKLNIYESDMCWHGACLALAELARRGLLLPERLNEVMPLVYDALAYDVLNGSFSVGTHVRDAACYVCWAFARAYDPVVLQPFVLDMATNLIITAVFDRENNVRRAASAALQENVGRLGTIPYGIDIITTADYFAVGNRRNAFLDISYFIAQYKEYCPSLVHHLAEVKLVHWDSVVRRLSAEAIEKLTAIACDDVVAALKGKLLNDFLNKDLNIRQGCVRGVGAVVCGIAKAFSPTDVTSLELFERVIGVETIVQIHKLIAQITTTENLKGLGGTMVKRAVLFCVRKLSLAAFPLSIPSTPILLNFNTTKVSPKELSPATSTAIATTTGDVTQFEYDAFHHLLDFLLSSLHDVDEECHEEAVEALIAFISTYSISTHERQDHLHSMLIPHLIDTLHSQSAHMANARSAVATCLGRLPPTVLSGDVAKVLTALLRSAKDCSGEANKMVSLRSASINASTSISTTSLLTEKDEELRMKLCVSVVEELIEGLNDYTVTSRGDVGSIVRLPCISGLCKCIISFLDKVEGFIDQSALLESCVCGLVKQLMEKLDRVRDEAGQALRGVVTALLAAFEQAKGENKGENYIKLKTTVSFLFETVFKNMSPHFDWSAAHITFPLLIPTLSFDALRRYSLQGLTSSVGGLTESLVRSSSKAVIEALFTMTDEQKSLLMLDLVDVMEKNIKDDLIVIPTLKTCDLLISSGCVDSLVASRMEEFAVNLATTVKQLMKKCTNVAKIVQCVHVLCGLLNFPSSFEPSMLSLSLALCHKYPRVRRATSETVYVAFLGLDIERVSRENATKVVDIVANTAWDGEIKTARSQRNAICDILGLPKPKQKAVKAKRPQAPKNEFDSYRDLVDRAGY
eukprot:m.72138 g.72138  ORF g.72138 m.72138 type:complete len:1268 (-) comp11728_c0_seq1:502-4305(-)